MDQVTAAFDATPRRDLLPRGVRRRPSYDGPLANSAHQTNSQPRTVDDMLRLLDVRAGQRVLDVGSGSGWTTALLAHLVGPAGSVLGDADGAPYDRILVSAMADELPLALVDQLTDDGVLVVPVDGTMLRVTNPGAVATEHGRYRFVPLR